MSSCISWLLLRYCYYEFTSNIHGTFDFNESMMKTDNVLNNGKSQSGSTHFPRAGRINTIESFKNTRDMFLWNANTCVRYFKLNRSIAGAYPAQKSGLFLRNFLYNEKKYLPCKDVCPHCEVLSLNRWSLI